MTHSLTSLFGIVDGVLEFFDSVLELSYDIPLRVAIGGEVHDAYIEETRVVFHLTSHLLNLGDQFLDLNMQHLVLHTQTSSFILNQRHLLSEESCCLSLRVSSTNVFKYLEGRWYGKAVHLLPPLYPH